MTTREILNSFSKEEGTRIFNAKQDNKSVYDLFVKKGLTDSYETFISETQKFGNEKLSTMSKEELMSQLDGMELSDSQLESVAGGCSDDTEKVATLSACTGVTVAASAAAMAY